VPVEAFIVKPAGEAEKDPALALASRDAAAEETEVQYEVAAYENVATGAFVIVTLVVAVVTAQPPLAAMVLVTV
jgi:hypothetical protein